MQQKKAKCTDYFRCDRHYNPNRGIACVDFVKTLGFNSSMKACLPDIDEVSALLRDLPPHVGSIAALKYARDLLESAYYADALHFAQLAAELAEEANALVAKIAV
ncbi:MAG TPA: hypothetical protein VHV26_07245 [Rhizomicrobium sp.]|jgi:hypothetical protein|nr:hypothetical protein [Rhizomicrobium sp.]